MATNSTVIRLSQNDLDAIEEYRALTIGFYMEKGLDFNADQLAKESVKEVLSEMLSEALYYSKRV